MEELFSEVCDFETNRQKSEREHMNKHTEVNKFGCDLCHFTTIKKAYLREHKRSVHFSYDSKKHTCKICNYTSIRRSKIKVHMNIHTGKSKFKCDLCDFATVHKNTMETHKKNMHTPYENRKFSCEICEHKTNYQSDLRRHMNIHTKEITFKCEFCDLVTIYESNLINHIKKVHTASTEEKKFSCKLCSYKTNAAESLKRHMNKHTKEFKYECNVCDFSTCHRSNLNRHIKRNHHFEKNDGLDSTKSCESPENDLNSTRTQMFNSIRTTIKAEEEIIEIGPNELQQPVEDFKSKCKLCDFVTPDKSSLDKHVKKFHAASSNKEKKFSCELCTYRTNVAELLRRHINKHTKEFKYECNVCDFYTFHQCNLTRHIRRIHDRKRINDNSQLNSTNSRRVRCHNTGNDLNNTSTQNSNIVLDCNIELQQPVKEEIDEVVEDNVQVVA